jgi:hypothetical protein
VVPNDFRDEREAIHATGDAEYDICPHCQVDVDWRKNHEHIVSPYSWNSLIDRYGIKADIPKRKRTAAISDIGYVFLHL